MWGAAAAFALSLGSAAPAPDPEIVVTGSRHPRDPVASFVEAATVETAGQLARFGAPVCPASFGLSEAQNRAIEARLGAIAEHLGIGVHGPGCRPNLVIVVAEEGGDFVRRLRREHVATFAALELPALREIMGLSGPVRAWQIVEPRGADGRPMERIAFIGDPPRPVPRGYQLTGVMSSLNQRPTRQDLSLSFIVFDLDAVEGLSLVQIADHAAMRAFARTEATGLPAGRSILTLFGDRGVGAEPAAALTNWDEAYLRALYNSGPASTAHQQRAGMARAMRRELAPGRAGRP
jgi:hypothetical protein